MPVSKREGYGTVIGNGTKDSATAGIPDDSLKGHQRSDLDKNHRSIHAYFTEFTAKKAFLYVVATLYVISCVAASIAELFITLPCPNDGEEPIQFPNPAYDGSRCPRVRQPMLLFLTPLECSFGRRLVLSILMGGLIGWERRQADRPAGIRTMSLVSLGSCLFTINSAFAFIGGPMDWDASRISAAIPSGVGFLGAGLIFKKTNSDEDNMVVHGLTTAASVWLSAAVGIACGGELYFAASFGTCLMMLLLRFGPRGSVEDEEDDLDDEDHEGEHEENNFREEVDEPFRIDIPAGGDNAAAAVIIRNIEGGKNLPPGLQASQRSNITGSSVDGSQNFTVTGESIENISITGELTPMLGQQTQTSRSGQQLHPLKYRKQRKTHTKTNKMRKKNSKPNLGSIV